MIKTIETNEKNILYTNFCRKTNLYWDGKYSIKDFIGQDRQWARMKNYEVYQIHKISDI